MQRRGGRVGTYKPVFGRVYKNHLFHWTDSMDPKSGFGRAHNFCRSAKNEVGDGWGPFPDEQFLDTRGPWGCPGKEIKAIRNHAQETIENHVFLMWRSLYLETHFVRRAGREAGGDEGKGDDEGGRRV